jgi:class 3 adenylate cyclase
MVVVVRGKKRSDELLLNILPYETAQELKQKGQAETKNFESVTVLFTDFKGFTTISEILTPKELITEIDTCFKGIDRIMTKYGIEKIKTIGDAYMAAGGLPKENATHPIDVVMAAEEILGFMAELKRERVEKNLPYFDIRIGIHSGPVIAGIVGIKKFSYDIWGDTVNTASRMESSGEINRINISGATHELIKSHYICEYRGKIEAKNKGKIDMYFIEKRIV